MVNEMEDVVIYLISGLAGHGYARFGVVGLAVFLAFVLVVAFFAGREQAKSELVNAEKEPDPGEDCRR
jgi:hypothetical protein